jgi:hypothetical protein
MFTEFQASGMTGAAHQYGAIDANGLDVHQVFGQVNVPAAGGDLMLRAGRQEISFGKARIFDTRNGPNSRRSYDAVRLVYKGSGWRLGALAGAYTADYPTSFDNGINWDNKFWAAHVAHNLGPLLPHSEVEVLYVDSKRGTASAQTFIGRRETLSTRFAGKEGS